MREHVIPSSCPRTPGAGAPHAWPSTALALLLALAAGLRAPRVEAGEGAPAVAGAHPAPVEAALQEAKGNRAELERFLAHAAATHDADWLRAARHLVAHMPGKGYIITSLKDARGNVIPYDPLAYPAFEQSLQAYEALEKQHGAIDFARDRIVLDVETLTAAYLVEHVEGALSAWRSTPEARRPNLATFLEYILPYRGSEEPAEPWMKAMRERFGATPDVGGDLADPDVVWRFANADVGTRITFNERYYLHPTDQGYEEMSRTRQGRCEDMTNLTTYAARALGLATAADYTPWWAHSDNNHAWNVLLDVQGRGRDPAQAHAAKVFRKTWSIQRDSLPFLLPPGREAPTRFLGAKACIDVTDQYGPTSDVRVLLDPAVAWAERFAYLCVFNGGEWKPIHWAAPGQVRDGSLAVFTNMGRGGTRGILYLPAVHDGKEVKAAAAPLLLHPDGSTAALAGEAAPVRAWLADTSPPQASPDTREVKPAMHLEVGTAYVLSQWTPSGWKELREVQVAGSEAVEVDGLPADGLFWLRPRESRRLERPFTVEAGRQRFW
ncbi:MAG: transglutaminase domain-containing protein [Planctomycetia bacterium]